MPNNLGACGSPYPNTKVYWSMISQTVEYSLRAVVVLAYQYNQPMTVREIAKVAQIPAPYLSKIMKELVHAGIVLSRRGLGGGFKLARSPKEITIWDISQAIDPVQRIHECPLGISGHMDLCPLHKRLDLAAEQIEKAFGTSTLDSIINENKNTPPLCNFPAEMQLVNIQQNLTQNKKNQTPDA